MNASGATSTVPRSSSALAPSGSTMLRSAGGAALMGAGGVMAFGCSIGQGLTGLSTLSLASFIAIAGIMLAEQGLLTCDVGHINLQDLVEEIVQQTKLALSVALKAASEPTA